MRQVKGTSAQKIDVEGMGPSDDTATHKPVADGGVANDDAPRSDECSALLRHVEAMNDVCSDFTALTNTQRRTSLGRHVTRFRKPLADMLTVTRSAQYAPAFALLSSSGAKPFSPSAIVTALDRVAELEAIAVKLEQLTLRVRDEILHTGANAIKPGLAAIELAQVVAKNNEDFRAKIAHTLNDLGAMTAAARRARTEAAAEEETPEEPTPDEG